MTLKRWPVRGFWLAILLGVSAGAAEPVRVLFIGNSLTATNDVPAMVAALAKADGTRMVTRTVAYPNFSLEDHWSRGEARRAISEGSWTFVVLQQGPSALPESRLLLVEYAKRFAAEAAKVKARVAMYMVWPSLGRFGDFDGVMASYEAAARETGGVFLGGGDAWRAAWKRDAGMELYGPDGFHPTALGSRVAAQAIYEGLKRAAASPGSTPWKRIE